MFSCSQETINITTTIVCKTVLTLGDTDRKFTNNKFSSNNVDDENDDNCQNINRKNKTDKKEKTIYFWLVILVFFQIYNIPLNVHSQSELCVFPSYLSFVSYFFPFLKSIFLLLFSVGIEKYRKPQRYHAASIFIEKRRE